MTGFAPDPPPAERHSGHHGHEGRDPAVGQRGHGSGHGWMMVACCIPMIGIAIALVATGVVGSGFLVVALACTAMMALMMVGMGHGGKH